MKHKGRMREGWESNAGVSEGDVWRKNIASRRCSASAAWAWWWRRATSSSTSASRSSSFARDAGRQAEAVALLREAKAAVKIKSEHVARVIDVGHARDRRALHGDGVPRGARSLGALEQRGPLPSTRPCDYVLQACEAIAEAHALGIVHRDLKPANLFLTRRADGRRCVKVLDFGISKTAGWRRRAGAHAARPRSWARRSTCRPSRCASRSVDARTDIWALGVILFELLTGQPPFTAASVTELAIKDCHRASAISHRRAPRPSPGLAAVIGRCLEKRS